MTDYTEFGERERSGWSDPGILDAYIRHFVPITDEIGGKIIADHVRSGHHVLDLCCGQGTLTAALSRAGAEVVGLDFSPEMVAKARATAPDVEVVAGDATALPFDDDSFDNVVCNFGMMHIADQPKALAEIRRVLKPGGSFVMATWAAPPASPAFAAMFGPLKALADFSAAPNQPDLFAFADPDQATALFKAAGLALQDHRVERSAWHVEEPSGLFDIFLTATVGAGMLIRSQSDDTIKKIEAAVSENVRAMDKGEHGYRIPVGVAVISGSAT